MLFLEQFDHLLGEMCTDQDLLRLDITTGKPLEKVQQLIFGQGERAARIDNLHPHLHQLILTDCVVLHEALDADIHVEVNTRVRVSIVYAKGENDSVHDIIKLVLFNVRVFEEAGQSYVILGFQITEKFLNLVHFLLDLFNLIL